MKNIFSSTKNENAVSTMTQQPEMVELSEQELEQTNGGCGYGYRHYRRWHKEYRRDRYGREIVVIVVDEY